MLGYKDGTGLGSKIGGGFFKNMVPALAGALPIVGGIAQNVIAGINTRAQNRYNSPEQQIARARKAHLPAASINNISAGNQSSVTPSNDIGTGEAGKHIASYNQNQKTLQEIGKIKEDTYKTNLENKKLKGELDWYLGKAGSDPSRTNLSSILGLEQQMKGLQNTGQTFANDIAKYSGVIRGAEARNIGTKINLENTEQGQRIKNMIQSNIGEGIKIEGYKTDNAIKELERRIKSVDAKFAHRLKEEEIENIMKRNGILLTEQGLKDIQLEISNATKGNVITQSGVETALAKMGLEQYGMNYKFNKDWQQIAEKARGLVNKPFSWDTPNEIGSWLFTTISNATGGGSIPNLHIPASKNFNTSNFNTTHNYGND